MIKIIIGIISIAAVFIFFIIINPLNKQTLISPKLQIISGFKNQEINTKAVTLETIFNKKQDSVADFPKEEIITIIATGDIIPARFINFQATKRNNFLWPFEKTADVLKNSDITFANLETPLIKNCPLTSEGMVFCGDEKNIQGLKFAGVDIVNLANNHSGNWGEKGIKDTTQLLANNNILFTGINDPVFKEIKGMKFAFLGYNDVGKMPFVSGAEENIISKEISDTKKEADVVIVAFHWGNEYTSEPSERQKGLAYLAVDSGADLIIGNHPHWIQPLEIYKNKIITYAHGNFIFDQFWSQKTLEGVIGKYTFYRNKLIDVEFLPVQIDNFGQPSFAKTPKKEEIINNMYQESLKLRQQNW